MKARFEITTGKEGKHYWHLKASNGEVMLSGRGYKTKGEVVNAIASVLRFGQYDKWYVRKESSGGQHFFQLKSPAGRILGWSEMCLSKEGRESKISAIRGEIENADITYV